MLKKSICLISFLAMISIMAGCGNVSYPTSPPADNALDLLRSTESGSNYSLITYSREMGTYPSQNRDIYIMRPDGSNVQPVITAQYDDDYPAFSPSGRMLAFTSNRSSGSTWGNHDLFTYSPWGGVTQLTDQAWEFNSFSPDWGPGVIVVSQHNTLIMAPFDVIPVNALDPWAAWKVNIPTGQIANYAPSVDPAGQNMVFAARPAGPTYFGSMELYLFTKGSNAAVQLTALGVDPNNMVFSTNPQFDFTGNRIVFQTSLWGDSEIAYLTLDPTKQKPYGPDDITRVTENPGLDVEPCWGPTGMWIAFASDRDGNFELYKTFDYWGPWDQIPPVPGFVRLTFTPETEANPDWSNFY